MLTRPTPFPVRVGRLLAGLAVVLVSGCTTGSEPATTERSAAETASTAGTDPPATTVPNTSSAPSPTSTTSPISITTALIDTEPFITWSGIETGVDGRHVRSVAATPAGFAAVGVAADGTDPRWWQSDDGVTWTSAPLDLPGLAAGAEFGDLHAGGAGFLLTGGGDPTEPEAEPDRLWLSIDGARWTLVTPEDVSGIPQPGGIFRQEGSLRPIAIADAGFLVAGGFRAFLDLEALVAQWFPEAAGSDFEWDFSGERGEKLVVLNDRGNVLGSISSEDLGFPGMPFEALFEGVGGDGLWFSTDGGAWIEVTTGLGATEIGGEIVGSGQWSHGEIGPEIAVGCGRWFYAAGSTDADPPVVRTWLSSDGLSWEELAIEGSGPVKAMACIGEGAAAGTGFERHAVWIATPGSGWEQAEATGLGVNATPDLYGGPGGLVAVERESRVPCADEPCQFLPDAWLVFTPDGATWSGVDSGSGRFGMNAVVREIAVGAGRLLALTEHPLDGIGQPGLAPTRLWVGIPGTRPAETAPPAPELGRTVEVVYPDHPRSFSGEPDLDILIRVHAGSLIGRVEVNGEPIPVRETDPTGATDYRTTITLDPGPNTLDLALYGPGVEEHTFRAVTFLPDLEERYARVTAVATDSITVDWIEVDESSEFLSFVDDDPGLLEQVRLSDDVIVMVSMAAVPLRYFIDIWTSDRDGASLRSSDWIVSIHEGAVVEMLQVVWG